MGHLFSKVWDRLIGKQEMRILMLGLDAAGKTTVLYRMKLGRVVETIPTIGFTVEVLEYRNLKFVVWDCGGQEKVRHMWNYYFQGAKGIIFVVDSNDRDRLPEVQLELITLLQQEYLSGVPLLLLANKQDLPDAMTAAELEEGLLLSEQPGLEPRPRFIQPACAISGNGLWEGLAWLSSEVARSA